MKPGRFTATVLVVIALCLGLSVSAWAAMKTYTVQPGDTLWSISQKFYGKKSLWPKLWEMNKKRTSNPHQISVGDVLIIYPLKDLLKGAVPPPSPKLAKNHLYDRGQVLDIVYPKYFTFVAAPKGIAGTGVHRIKVRRRDPITGKLVVTYAEVRQVGEVIGSTERGYKPPNTGDIHGKVLLSWFDDVIIRFTADVARILDSRTHEDPDPYFREFPIYGYGEDIVEPDRDRHDKDQNLGRLHIFKGRLTVVARVETLKPMTDQARRRLATTKGLNRDSEPVSYVAKITNSVHPISIGDRIFLFKSLYPGPDRVTHGKKKRSKAGKWRDINQ